MKMKECINSNKTILSNRYCIIVIYSALKIHSHLTGFLLIQLRDSGIYHAVYPVAHGQHTGTMGRNDTRLSGVPADDIPEDHPFRGHIQGGCRFI